MVSDEPALDDWIEEARACISTQQLQGEVAACRLVTYLDWVGRSEIRYQPNDVCKDANNIIEALEDVYGEKETTNQLLRHSSFVDSWLASPSQCTPTVWLRSSVESNVRFPKNDEERDMMLCD